MKYKVSFSPKAQSHLSNIFEFISSKTSEDIAAKFVTSIIDYCVGFETFPERGLKRDDLRIGLRVVGFKRRVSIAFYVEERDVVILGVFYGGLDFEGEIVGDWND